ncbi:MAG: hypothetical protein MRJ92_01705 [Nitrospira sp.]|nr:hypothetical protein [Nitrospira sp.]
MSTRLKASGGLNHSAAISFEVDMVAEVGVAMPILRLPEANNGLGYQNLISMIFRLMSFRDAWMRVSKASKGRDDHPAPNRSIWCWWRASPSRAGQQVFIKRPAVLRPRDLGEQKTAHPTRGQHTLQPRRARASFSCLRYFRRLPAGMVAKVASLDCHQPVYEVFGPGSGNQTVRHAIYARSMLICSSPMLLSWLRTGRADVGAQFHPCTL